MVGPGQGGRRGAVTERRHLRIERAAEPGIRRLGQHVPRHRAAEPADGSRGQFDAEHLAHGIGIAENALLQHVRHHCFGRPGERGHRLQNLRPGLGQVEQVDPLQPIELGRVDIADRQQGPHHRRDAAVVETVRPKADGDFFLRQRLQVQPRHGQERAAGRAGGGPLADIRIVAHRTSPLETGQQHASAGAIRHVTAGAILRLRSGIRLREMPVDMAGMVEGDMLPLPVGIGPKIRVAVGEPVELDRMAGLAGLIGHGGKVDAATMFLMAGGAGGPAIAGGRVAKHRGRQRKAGWRVRCGRLRGAVGTPALQHLRRLVMRGQCQSRAAAVVATEAALARPDRIGRQKRLVQPDRRAVVRGRVTGRAVADLAMTGAERAGKPGFPRRDRQRDQHRRDGHQRRPAGNAGAPGAHRRARHAGGHDAAALAGGPWPLCTRAAGDGRAGAFVDIADLDRLAHRPGAAAAAGIGALGALFFAAAAPIQGRAFVPAFAMAKKLQAHQSAPRLNA